LFTVLIAAFLLAGFIKGVTGLGLPTVGIGLLSLAVAPAEAAALITLPSLVTNAWQMAAGPALAPLLGRLWPMMAGICLGSLAGAGLLTGADDARAASSALGLAVVLYAATGLLDLRLPRVPARQERVLGPVAGATTGLVTGATGVLVIPAVPYLQALGLDRDELVQALGLSFTVSTLALGVALAGEGLFSAATASLSLLALAPAIGGMLAGQAVRRAVNQEVFRRCFFGGLLMLGAHLASRGW
jgi:uncharacterized membrane protein YfcA